MCGIGGILRTDGQPIPEEWLDAIDARIAYRGPDGQGRFRDWVEYDDPTAHEGRRIVEVAFVHRRLSIIDHNGGKQPMVSPQGRNDSEGLVAVVFNGCIYNHRELRKELEDNRHTFVTDHSDTEVLIHGWREWGEQLIDHLEGMYSLAIWDRNRRRLFLGRDAFGEKPLYMSDVETVMANDDFGISVIAFSSEPTSLYAIPPCEEAMSPWCRMGTWLIPYLLLGHAIMVLPGPDETDLDMVTPGSGRPIDAKLSERQYRATYARRRTDHPREPSVEALLEQAVARRLEADVPLGCFLSGGVDSSLISLFARKHKPDLRTFSVRMPDPRFDESPYAERVAYQLGTNHETLDVAANPAEDLVRLIGILGLPFGDSSLLPTYWLSKAARQHVKVALSGDGGDEMFMGYDRYSAARILVQHWRWLRLLPLSPLYRFHPKSMLHRLARFVDAARDYDKLGVVAIEQLFTLRDLRELEPRIADERWQGILCGDHHIETCLNKCLDFVDAWRSRDSLLPGDERLRGIDVESYLPNDLLTKVDTASMACGLEVRCPFLDRDLARAALSAPIEQLMPRGQRKGLLRQIARKYLPKEIVDRPKMGFAIPIGEWFRDDDLPHKRSGMKTLLLDHLNSAEPFEPIQLNRKAVQRFIDEHMSGKRDHGQRLFTLLTLSIWARQTQARETRPSAAAQRTNDQ